MNSPNNWGGKTSTRYLCLLNEASCTRNGLNLINLLVKATQGNLPLPIRKQGVSEALGCSLQTVGKALLLKITCTHLIEHRENELPTGA